MMTNEEAIKLLLQIMDALLASSWLPSTDNLIKECFGMAINALKAQEVSKNSPKVDSDSGDLISRQTILDALDEIESEVAGGEGFLYEKWREYFCDLSSAQPEVKSIGYQDCANAMPEMWRDKVVTDGDYSRIMDKLNKYWEKKEGA